MKYKCKLKVSQDSNGEGTYYIGVNCSCWKYTEYFCIEVLRGDEELLNYYKNINMDKIVSKIRDKIIKTHYPSYEVKEAINLIQQKGGKIIIKI